MLKKNNHGNEMYVYAEGVKLPCGNEHGFDVYFTKDYAILEAKRWIILGREDFEKLRVLPDFTNTLVVDGICFGFEVLLAGGTTERFFTTNLKEVLDVNTGSLVWFWAIATKTIEREKLNDDVLLDFFVKTLKLFSILETAVLFPLCQTQYEPIRDKKELLEYHEELLYQAIWDEKEREEKLKEIREFYERESFERCVEYFIEDCDNYLWKEEGYYDSMALSAYAGAIEALERLGKARIIRKWGRSVIAKWLG